MGETRCIRSQCVGRRTVSAKVDAETKQYVQERAEEAGITPAEFLRRLLDVYRESERGNLSCSRCATGLDLSAATET